MLQIRYYTDYTYTAGDDFVVYNRARHMQAYINELRRNQSLGIDADYTNIIIWEPDMLCLRALDDFRAEPERPIGHRYWYMEEDIPRVVNIASRCSVRSTKPPPVGAPMAFHIDDLAMILTTWIEKTILVRTAPWAQDPDSHLPSWIADMWGLGCALADVDWNVTVSLDVAPEPGTPFDKSYSPTSFAMHYTFLSEWRDPANWETIVWRMEKRYVHKSGCEKRKTA